MPSEYLMNFDQQDFLKDYWQKKPLLIKGGLAAWNNPITADELAGLALEEEVESRLIEAQPVIDSVTKSQWSLEHGPFAEQRFSSLGEKNWTLLVQAVDHYAPEVAQLLTYFGFIPGWQIDDVMVSYATKGGGVGPHYDRYDVFLVQGQGQREWQIGQRCNKHTALQDGQALSLLTEFNCEQSHTLSAGDILYVPPYVSHWGTALDNNCMTYSVGFRSPSQAEMLDDYSGFMQDVLSEDDRFRDATLSASAAGAIDEQTIDSLALMLSERLRDKNHLRHWFGRWASQTKYSVTNTQDESIENNNAEDLIINEIDFNNTDLVIFRDSASRFYYIDENKKEGTQLLLFVNGREIQLGGELEALPDLLKASIKTLCNQQSFSAEQLQPWLNDPANYNVLAELFENGELYSE